MEDLPPILDVPHLARLRELGDGEAAQVLVDMAQRYLDSIPPQLEHMRALLAEGNARALEHEAHGLAGSSGMYGLPRLRCRSQALQARAKSGVLEGAAKLLADVEHAFTEAKPVLLAALNGERPLP